MMQQDWMVLEQRMANAYTLKGGDIYWLARSYFSNNFVRYIKGGIFYEDNYLKGLYAWLTVVCGFDNDELVRAVETSATPGSGAEEKGLGE